MKCLLFLPLVIVSFYSYSQENFKLEDELIWQKVYETDLTFEEVSNRLINSGVFSQYEIYNNTLTGDLKGFEADYEGAGYTRGNTLMHISGNSINSFSVIEYKDGKYRVTLKKIILTKKYDDPFSQQGQKSTLESWAVKKGEFRNWFKKHSGIYDLTFDQLFTIKEVTADNW